MALLNVSICSSKLPPKPSSLSPINLTLPANTSLSPPAILRPRYTELPRLLLSSISAYLALRTPAYVVKNRLETSGSSVLSLGESVCKASLIALLSASLFVANPAFAFKGGGPYGAEVTRGQDLTGKDFSGKTLIKQDFKTSILRQANFKGAKLLGASFFDADLTGADLSDADLRAVDFSLANVTKANLSNANLEGAVATGNTSFKGSNITGADFTDVPLREDQREYLCKVADGVNPTTGNPTRETLLCN
ncbi:thylakoid lumenal 15 kDa protein 1 [Pyrus ussuriensis x Pyrus communis]|uniref:Thylakoid lumenal 15 kDa protein 1 n=1 Tax=Pyrus ussuriensis x Pyrus communis TaxID=2448454 RepID=A0A5N5EZG9_9ROSA|nr:thylakoid lumenal 15 kDa protein 1 [Pyrus ussuriensis x Pyrus communis]